MYLNLRVNDISVIFNVNIGFARAFIAIYPDFRRGE